MNMKFVKVCVAFIAAAAFSMSVSAQDPKTLDELLQMIQSAKISESADTASAKLDSNRTNASRLHQLKKAQNTKTAEERRSDRLEQVIRDNDVVLAGLREQRDKRLGSLKELFGHLTGAAGDIRANLNSVNC